MMQRKRKSKVYILAEGWEDWSSSIALGVLRSQDFIVVCTDVDGLSWKTGLVVINSHSLSYILVAEVL
jgi:hypothetical protein